MTESSNHSFFVFIVTVVISALIYMKIIRSGERELEKEEGGEVVVVVVGGEGTVGWNQLRNGQ